MKKSLGKNVRLVIIVAILVLIGPTLLEYAKRMKVENEWGGRKILMYDGMGVEKIRINGLEKDICLKSTYTEEQRLALSKELTGTADIEEVTEILNKKSEEISDEEYDVLALAYLQIKGDDLEEFFLPMIKKKEKHNESWYASTMYYKVYSEWEIDYEKLEQIGERIAEYERAMLQSIGEYRAKGDKDAVIECAVQRIDILQRMTLLDVINQVGTFDGEYEADELMLDIEETQNGELLLKINESEAVSGMKPMTSTLRESTITISSTENGMFVYGKQSQYSGEILKGYLSSKTAKKYKKSKNLELIEKQMKDMNRALVYDDYDCWVNFVDYNLVMNSTHVFYPYEGEQTKAKIDSMNYCGRNGKNEDYERKQLAELLKKEFPENGLSLEIVLTRPEDVFKFVKGLSRDQQNIYFEIISNKID